MGLILRTAVLTDLGLRRDNNEDSAYAGRRLLVVADGMGGLPAGELASDLAIGALVALDADGAGEAGAGEDAGGEDARGGDGGGDGGAGAGEDLVAALRAAFDAATARIHAAASEDDAVRNGMGTTVTAILFDRAPEGTPTAEKAAGSTAGGAPVGNRAALMHVGDSRAYQFREGVLTQLTKDDTYVQALVDQGVITPAGARRHPQRSLVTQAMQGQPIDPFSVTLEPRPGDLYLLCSDGLTDVVPDDELASIVVDRTDLADCARRLVAAAVEGGAPDNVTVVLGEVLAA